MTATYLTMTTSAAPVVRGSTALARAAEKPWAKASDDDWYCNNNHNDNNNTNHNHNNDHDKISASGPGLVSKNRNKVDVSPV